MQAWCVRGVARRTKHTRAYALDALAGSIADAVAATAPSAPAPATAIASAPDAYTFQRPLYAVPRAMQALDGLKLPHTVPRLHYITKAALVDAALPRAMARPCTLSRMIGLDLEWNIAPTKGKAAVLQLATATDIFVIHLTAMKCIPDALTSVLEDASIPKVGVAIQQDLTKLRRDYGVAATGALELSRLAWHVDAARWHGRKRVLISLRDLCMAYLSKDLAKGPTRISTWTRVPLTSEQVEYAASDAYVSLELAHAMLCFAQMERGIASAELHTLIEETSHAPVRRTTPGRRTVRPTAQLAHHRTFAAWRQGASVEDVAVERSISLSTAATYIAKALQELPPGPDAGLTETIVHRLRVEFSDPRLRLFAAHRSRAFLKHGVFTYDELRQFLTEQT